MKKKTCIFKTIQKESVEVEVLKSSTQHSFVNKVFVLNISKEDVESQPNSPPQELINLDPDDQPIWESAKNVAPTPISAIVRPGVDDNFVINSTHLKMIRGNIFDGYLRTNPHDHVREFLAICDMFKYGETQSEVVKLLIFPLSLCDKAKIWFNKLNEESITSWEKMRRAFINKFFPPSLFNRLCLEIRRAIIQIFYHGLNEPTQGILDETARGIFLYKSPNQAFQFLEDKVLFKLDWSTKSQNKHHQKSVAFADGDKIVPIVNKVDVRVQNFKNHFVKEAAQFVQDFKSLAKEADDSLDKIKVLECEIEHLLREVVS
ncbi:reverse transcriptase domain-containing protein [Tanacetum coccineum]